MLPSRSATKALCVLPLLTRSATHLARNSERHIVVYGAVSTLQTRYCGATKKPVEWALSLFFHSVGCLTTGPHFLPKRVPQTVRSSASSFNFQYPLFSVSSCLRFLPRLPATFILTSIFPAITCCRRQFFRKMWPTHLALHYFNPLAPNDVYIYIYKCRPHS